MGLLGGSDIDGQVINYLVKSVRLRTPVPLLFHAYVLPFVFAYVAWLSLWLSGAVGEAYELLAIGVVVVALLQALTALSCLWSVRLRCLLTTRAAPSVGAAKLAHVIPTENNGSDELVPLFSQQQPLPSHPPLIGFRFQKAKFIWNGDKKRFEALRYPVERALGDYLDWRGLASEDDVGHVTRTYGKNALDLDVPEFLELFKERVSAPFFVFQVFCVGLWCLDEYWYFSVFTLFMLIVFECTLVYQQMRNMSEIRKMDNTAFSMHVYRCRKWRTILTSDLLPGDLVSITRSEQNVVPCDLLLLRGSCIVDESMLTGESVPQMKEPLPPHVDRLLPLDIDSCGRLHVLFGGTRVVQHSSPDKTPDTIRAADNGCIAYVLRTSFATSQGTLLRTIMYSVKRVTANNKETFGFISFLLVFAMAAAWYLWTEGSKNPDRNRYKLFLECTLIITSVIPPELPIELSLAVNNSLISLARLLVFCTEPFRIPSAGKVEICCFDKTGTLTSNDLIVEGVAGLHPATGVCDRRSDSFYDYSNDISSFISPIESAQRETIQVLATCHALAHLDSGLVGDPLEKALLRAIDWTLTKGDGVVPSHGAMPGMKIFKRFHFSSSLKRMSVLAGYTKQGSSETCYVGTVKGAPEVLKDMFSSVPSHYDQVYLALARRGARVLALGIRELGALSNQQVKDLDRDAIESNLSFAGFVIISCPLKSDSRAVIREILNASHQVTMITGDNALTACHVAAELGFTDSKKITFILSDRKGPDDWRWWCIDGSIILPFEPKSWPEFFSENNLCITGDAIAFLKRSAPRLLPLLLPRTRVFARVAPKQKELIITTLKRCGYTTLMCGDGTNDVGALKHAHVGVAILSYSVKRAGKASQEQSLMSVENSNHKEKSAGQNTVPRRIPGRRTPMGTSKASSTPLDARQKRVRQLQKMMRQIEEEDECRVVKLGDASIAAPFTSKLSSIESVCHIIKQGRCTLVTTLQMFKILALNALILAYSQSVLYLDGVKFSDGQATLQGLLLAFSFLFISRCKPLKVLSSKRPLPNIFNAYTILTVTAQFAVHFSSLVLLVSEAKKLMPVPADGQFIDLERDFEPNILNSAVYMVSMTLQVATFAINYRGHPFMQSLASNKPLLYSIIGALTVVFTLASGAIPSFNEQFSVVEFPDEFRTMLLCTLSIDVCAAFIVDRVLRFLFDRTYLRSEISR